MKQCISATAVYLPDLTLGDDFFTVIKQIVLSMLHEKIILSALTENRVE